MINAFVSHLTSMIALISTQSTSHYRIQYVHYRIHYVYTTLYTYCDNMNNVYIRGGHLSVRLKVVSIY